MATKEENLKRLCELAERLGREPDVSGSAADIAQRVAELEEELGDAGEVAEPDTYSPSKDDPTAHKGESVPEQPGIVTRRRKRGQVTVVALATLHTKCNGSVIFVSPGTSFRVSAEVAASMAAGGLAKRQ
ncbi:DNA packaging protein FI [Escherichia coli LT-68]|nr:DNA packaging protein FI [Escherichia coli LT-68]